MKNYVFWVSLLFICGESIAADVTAQDISTQNITTQDTTALAVSEHGSQSQETPWIERTVPPIDTFRLEDEVNEKERFLRLIAIGDELFSASFTSLDGVGRPMATQAIIPTKRRRQAKDIFSRTAGLDGNACVSCHNLPIPGGAGDFSVNVFVSTGFQHTDFNTTDPEFSNERNTNHLFGAGLVELLAREMSESLQAQRINALRLARSTQQTVTESLSAKGIDFGSLTVNPDGTVDPSGIEGVDQDLIIRPFSHKGVMTSLRQFTVNALNHHHGMQASERFGPRWTGVSDFDEDAVENEIAPLHVSALVAWQASLEAPTRDDELNDEWQIRATRGEQLFTQLGCAHCHRPNLPLDSLVFSDPGPVDYAGTLRQGEHPNHTYNLSRLPWTKSLQRDDKGRVLVPLFGDLKRHVISDQRNNAFGNERLAQRFVPRNVFMTSELWGVASTAPYGHRGDMTTLAEAIAAHGGDASASSDEWNNLDDDKQLDVIAFLKTLIIGDQ